MLARSPYVDEKEDDILLVILSVDSPTGHDPTFSVQSLAASRGASSHQCVRSSSSTCKYATTVLIIRLEINQYVLLSFNFLTVERVSLRSIN